MREEEECEPGCYKHIYFLQICEEKILHGECERFKLYEGDDDQELRSLRIASYFLFHDTIGIVSTEDRKPNYIVLSALIVSLLSLGWNIYNSWTILQLTIEQQELEHFEPWVRVSAVGEIKLVGHQAYHKTAFPLEIEVASPHPYRIEVMNQTSFSLNDDVRESTWLLPEYLNQTGIGLLKATGFLGSEGVRSHTLYMPVGAILSPSQDAPPEMDVGSFWLKIKFLDITSREEKIIDVRTDVVWKESLLRDLLIEFFLLPEEFVAGRTYEITIQVKNVGETDVGTFNVELRANEDLLNKTEIVGLPSRASLTLPLKWTPSRYFPGDYILRAIIDPDDHVDELDETNNIATVEVTVSPPPREIIWLEEWGPIIAGAVTIVIIVIIAIVITRERR